MPFRYTWYYTFFVIILIYVITRMRPIATGIRASRWHFDTVTSSSTSSCPYHDFITITPIVIFGYFSTSFWTVKSADVYVLGLVCATVIPGGVGDGVGGLVGALVLAQYLRPLSLSGAHTSLSQS